MRVVVKTQSSAWQVVELAEREPVPDDALHALVQARGAIDAGDPLGRLTPARGGDRFYPAGLEYVAAEETA